MILFIFTCILSISINSTTAHSAELTPIEVTAREHDSKNQAAGTTSRTLVEKETGESRIDQVVRKLPGVVTRNNSGQGSLTTATSPLSLGSGTTAVSVDAIPIPDPSQLGVNLALFPSVFFSSAEVLTPFDVHESIRSVQLPSQGSRVALNTQKLKFGESTAFGGDMNYGSASTFQVSPVYKLKTDSSDLLIGTSFQSTKGNFKYTDPVGGDQKVRENNDSASGSALVKYRTDVGSSSSVDILTMHTRIDRTNPGSLSFPGRDHERDTFHLIGISYTDMALCEGTQFHSSASATWNRVQNEIDAATRTDAHTFGSFAQAGISKKKGDIQYFFNVDDAQESMSDSSGLYDRNTLGLTPRVTWYMSERLKLMPRVRAEYNTHYDWVGDAGLSLGYGDEADDFSVLLSHAYQHAYAPIMGLSGYFAGGLQVLPNPDLKRERTSTSSAAVLLTVGDFRLNQTAFYHAIQDRSVFVMRGFTQAIFTNVPRAKIYGTTSDLQYRFSDAISSRISATVLRAFDVGSGRDFPYKPNFQGLATLDVRPFPKWSLSLEEHWVGKRKIDLTTDQSLSPYAETNLSLQYALMPQGSLYFRIENMWNEGGFVSSGYPYVGRSFTLGLQIDKI